MKILKILRFWKIGCRGKTVLQKEVIFLKESSKKIFTIVNGKLEKTRFAATDWTEVFSMQHIVLCGRVAEVVRQRDRRSPLAQEPLR